MKKLNNFFYIYSLFILSLGMFLGSMIRFYSTPSVPKGVANYQTDTFIPDTQYVQVSKLCNQAYKLSTKVK